MTRKDYQIVASMIAETRKNHAEVDALDELVENLGFAFALDNPRFDRAKFRKACE